MRRMGMIEPITQLSKEKGAVFCNRIKALASMDLAERRRPADGRWSEQLDGRQVDFRVNSLMTLKGEDLALRLLARRGEGYGMEELGMVGNQLVHVKSMLTSMSGLLVVTGPTGAGKTTTLYSMLERLNDGTRKINTLEDPVEFAVPGIRQSQVNEKIDLGFGELLRGILRQGPDVIMIGEIRDEDTAQTAVRAANSGHLVLSTLHSPVAAGAVQSMLALGVRPFFLANSLLGIVAQRLVRQLSPVSRIPYDMSHSPETFDEVREYLGPGQGKVIFGPNTEDPHSSGGYVSQTGLFEVMTMNRRLRELIADARPSAEIHHAAVQRGMLDFRLAALLHVARGITCVSEMSRVTPADEVE